MKKYIFFLFIILLSLVWLTSSYAIWYEHDPHKCGNHHSTSVDETYSLNTFILEQYNIVSYGEPFGSFLEADWGKMTNKTTGKKGEYQYLGYDFYETTQIPNDRYFNRANLFGNVFNSTYSNVTWIPHGNGDSLLRWKGIKEATPEIIEYMETTQFWDADHVTAAQQPTGYTLQTFSQQVLGKAPGDYIYYGEFITPPTKDSSGKVTFYCLRASGEIDYNSVDDEAAVKNAGKEVKSDEPKPSESPDNESKKAKSKMKANLNFILIA